MEIQTETELKVRTAATDDSEVIARILVEAFPALYEMAFGIVSEEKNVEILTALFQASHLALDKTRVCVRDGQIVGLTILHVGDPIGRGRARDYARLLRRHLQPGAVWRAFFGGLSANRTLVRRMPHGPDLLYIEALAVLHGERGKGVGTLLLQDAFDWAIADGRTRLALHVLHSNTGARRLYEKMGFTLWQPTVWDRLRNRVAPVTTWSALLMLRVLDSP
ncbi:MAG: acetyltransferase [Chthonomonadaceae bacterium]|nr:acetyltransferase [Chthonomonadaceae bacterium]